jgi:hypothetical protein
MHSQGKAKIEQPMFAESGVGTMPSLEIKSHDAWNARPPLSRLAIHDLQRPQTLLPD